MQAKSNVIQSNEFADDIDTFRSQDSSSDDESFVEPDKLLATIQSIKANLKIYNDSKSKDKFMIANEQRRLKKHEQMLEKLQGHGSPSDSFPPITPVSKQSDREVGVEVVFVPIGDDVSFSAMIEVKAFIHIVDTELDISLIAKTCVPGAAEWIFTCPFGSDQTLVDKVIHCQGKSFQLKCEAMAVDVVYATTSDRSIPKNVTVDSIVQLLSKKFALKASCVVIDINMVTFKVSAEQVSKLPNSLLVKNLELRLVSPAIADASSRSLTFVRDLEIPQEVEYEMVEATMPSSAPPLSPSANTIEQWQSICKSFTEDVRVNASEFWLVQLLMCFKAELYKAPHVNSLLTVSKVQDSIQNMMKRLAAEGYLPNSNIAKDQVKEILRVFHSHHEKVKQSRDQALEHKTNLDARLATLKGILHQDCARIIEQMDVFCAINHPRQDELHYPFDEMVCKKILFTLDRGDLRDELEFSVEFMKNNVAIFRENMESLIVLCKKLLDRVRPVDVDFLLELVQHNIEVGERELVGKDVLFLMGGSGAGKSTTMHKLNNASFVTKNIAGAVGVHYEPRYPPGSDQFEHIKTNPFDVSETNRVVALNIEFKGREFVAVDSPGFGATEGVEVDIANGITISRSLRRCKSVKPVVVMSRMNLGDKAGSSAFKGMCSTILDMLTTPDVYLGYFDYVFTKFENGSEETIPRSFENFVRNLDPCEYALKLLYSDIVKKCKDSGTVLINPIKDKRDVILDRVFSPRSQTITDPENAFKDFLSQDSRMILVKQLDRMQESVKNALDRVDIPWLNIQMARLIDLANSVDFPECKERLHACMEMISKSCLQSFNVVQESFDNFKDGSNIASTVIETCVDAIISTVAVDELLSELQLRVGYSGGSYSSSSELLSCSVTAFFAQNEKLSILDIQLSDAELASFFCRLNTANRFLAIMAQQFNIIEYLSVTSSLMLDSCRRSMQIAKARIQSAIATYNSARITLLSRIPSPGSVSNCINHAVFLVKLAAYLQSSGLVFSTSSDTAAAKEDGGYASNFVAEIEKQYHSQRYCNNGATLGEQIKTLHCFLDSIAEAITTTSTIELGVLPIDFLFHEVQAQLVDYSSSLSKVFLDGVLKCSLDYTKDQLEHVHEQYNLLHLLLTNDYLMREIGQVMKQCHEHLSQLVMISNTEVVSEVKMLTVEEFNKSLFTNRVLFLQSMTWYSGEVIWNQLIDFSRHKVSSIASKFSGTDHKGVSFSFGIGRHASLSVAAQMHFSCLEITDYLSLIAGEHRKDDRNQIEAVAKHIMIMFETIVIDNLQTIYQVYSQISIDEGFMNTVVHNIERITTLIKECGMYLGAAREVAHFLPIHLSSVIEEVSRHQMQVVQANMVSLDHILKSEFGWITAPFSSIGEDCSNEFDSESTNGLDRRVDTSSRLLIILRYTMKLADFHELQEKLRSDMKALFAQLHNLQAMNHPAAARMNIAVNLANILSGADEIWPVEDAISFAKLSRMLVRKQQAGTKSMTAWLRNRDYRSFILALQGYDLLSEDTRQRQEFSKYVNDLRTFLESDMNRLNSSLPHSADNVSGSFAAFWMIFCQIIEAEQYSVVLDDVYEELRSAVFVPCEGILRSWQQQHCDKFDKQIQSLLGKDDFDTVATKMDGIKRILSIEHNCCELAQVDDISVRQAFKPALCLICIACNQESPLILPAVCQSCKTITSFTSQTLIEDEVILQEVVCSNDACGVAIKVVIGVKSPLSIAAVAMFNRLSSKFSNAMGKLDCKLSEMEKSIADLAMVETFDEVADKLPSKEVLQSLHYIATNASEYDCSDYYVAFLDRLKLAVQLRLAELKASIEVVDRYFDEKGAFIGCSDIGSREVQIIENKFLIMKELVKLLPDKVFGLDGGFKSHYRRYTDRIKRVKSSVNTNINIMLQEQGVKKLLEQVKSVNQMDDETTDRINAQLNLLAESFKTSLSSSSNVAESLQVFAKDYPDWLTEPERAAMFSPAIKVMLENVSNVIDLVDKNTTGHYSATSKSVLATMHDSIVILVAFLQIKWNGLEQHIASVQVSTRFLSGLLTVDGMFQKAENQLNLFAAAMYGHLMELDKNLKQFISAVPGGGSDTLDRSIGLDEKQVKKYYNMYQEMMQHCLVERYRILHLHVAAGRLSEAMQELSNNSSSPGQLIETHNRLLLKYELQLQRDLLNPLTSNPINQSDRDDFYCIFNWCIRYLEVCKFNPAKLEELKEPLKSHLEGFKLTAIDVIERFDRDDERSHNIFNIHYGHLRAIEVNCADFKDRASNTIKVVNTAGFAKIEAMVQRAVLSPARAVLSPAHWADAVANVHMVMDALIQLKRLANRIQAFSKYISEQINALLKENYLKRSGGEQFVYELGQVLAEETSDGLGPQIIAEHGAFSALNTFYRNKEFNNLPIDQVLSRMEGDDLVVEHLKSHYETFLEYYWKAVDKCLAASNRHRMHDIPRNVKPLAARVLRSTTPQEVPNLILEIAAYVFAYWTLSDPDLSSNSVAKDGTAGRMFLKQPHAGQVLAILRLLGFDSGEDLVTKPPKASSLLGSIASFFSVSEPGKFILRDHLVEVLTGEGKSIVLAVTAAVLGLMKYQVDVVCYSFYLKERDRIAFKDLFAAFNLEDVNCVTYGTFHELSEKFLNARGDIRQMVKDAILSNGSTVPFRREEHATKPRVLLIDEVDVFFDPSFYGGIYNVFSTIGVADLPEVEGLVRFVWSLRNNREASDAIWHRLCSSSEYQNCMNKLGSGWQFLIEEACKNMINDVRTIETHQYLSPKSDGRIGYLCEDGTVSYNKVTGYKTMFAYFKEHELGKVTEDVLRRNIGLLINAGAFSYAEIPKLYQVRLGVSGTLQTLSTQERDILRDDFKIAKFTNIPSAYGEKKLVFNWHDKDYVRIESDDKYYAALVDEIRRRMLATTGTGQRAVLVFFRDRVALDAFSLSKPFEPLRDSASKIIGGMDDEQRDWHVNYAVDIGRITLLTREFGRGTDFNCRNRILDERGGLHVIQAFLSEEPSEEKQIKGRTARQGRKGSYSLVILQSELEKVGFTAVEITELLTKEDRYTDICRYRKETFEKNFPTRFAYLEDIRKEHIISQEFLGNLTRRRWKEVQSVLRSRNEARFGLCASRTIILMDATGSMSDLIEKVKMIVKSMMMQGYEVLRLKGVDVAFEMMLAVYRNYSSRAEQIYESSGWESNPTNLISFVDKIRVNGGQGNEAIEVGLMHANHLADQGLLTQIILIGDMPPNTADDVAAKRAGSGGDAYWGRHPDYATATNSTNEIARLCARGIPVHCCYVKLDAKSSFEIIAAETNGKSCGLDVNSANGAEVLQGLVMTQILADVGNRMDRGGKMASDLVGEYRKRFNFREEGFR